MRITSLHGSYFPSRKSAFLFLVVLFSTIGLLPTNVPVYAQDASPVQEIEGKINPGEVDVFVLKDLKQGEVLYAALETTSGDLDPELALVPASVDLPELISTYRAGMNDILQTSEFPLAEIPALNDKTILAWDDDSGPGNTAAMQFHIPEDGDYILGSLGALSAAGRITFGNYRLILGLDVPEVLTGKAVPNGAVIATQNDALLGWPGRIQEYTGSLDASRPSITLPLFDLDPGDKLSMLVEERERLWRSLLSAEAAVADDLDFAALAGRFEMTGGYIKNATVRAAFLADDEGTHITMAHLVRAARSEYAAMGKVIGQH